MEGLALVVLVFVILAVVGLVVRMLPTAKAGLPYRMDTPLFTPAERSFLGVLDQAVAGRYRVFGKVRLADVIDVARTRDRSARQTAFNRISSKHFDFVLCDPSDLSVVCVIELDDRSHGNAARGKRDRFLGELCEHVGLPLVRFPARRGYSASDVWSQLETALGVATPVPETPPSTETETVATTASDQVKPDPSDEAADSEDPPSCPKCGAAMAIKTARRGANAGRRFWACSLFPKCRTAIPVDAPLGSGERVREA